MSFQLTNKNTLTLDPTWKHHPYQSPYKTYASEARKQLIKYYDTHIVQSKFNNGKATFFKNLPCNNYNILIFNNDLLF